MFRRLAFASALIVCFVAVGRAQTVDDIVAKSIAAHGGAQKLKAVQTMRMTGTMSMMGMDVPMVVEQKRPKKVRLDFNIQGTENTQGYDGQMGWWYMPIQQMSSPQPVPADMMKDLDEQADMDLPYMDYKAKGNQVELAGKEAVDGTDTYKMKVTLKAGDVRYYYLDARSYLPIKVEGKRTVGGQEVNTETIIGDYKDESGLMMPHVIENRMPGMTQKVTIQKVEINVPIDDARFKMPVVK